MYGAMERFVIQETIAQTIICPDIMTTELIHVEPRRF